MSTSIASGVGDLPCFHTFDFYDLNCKIPSTN